MDEVEEKLKSLVTYFGFDAKRQVRGTSLSTVLARLDAWRISHKLVGGRSANDYITLWVGATRSPDAIKNRTPDPVRAPKMGEQQLVRAISIRQLRQRERDAAFAV